MNAIAPILDSDEHARQKEAHARITAELKKFLDTTEAALNKLHPYGKAVVDDLGIQPVLADLHFKVKYGI